MPGSSACPSPVARRYRCTQARTTHWGSRRAWSGWCAPKTEHGIAPVPYTARAADVFTADSPHGSGLRAAAVVVAVDVHAHPVSPLHEQCNELHRLVRRDNGEARVAVVLHHRISARVAVRVTVDVDVV